MGSLNAENQRIYETRGMVEAYSGNRLLPQEEAIFKGVNPGRLLDLGCGTGRTTSILSWRGFNVEGVDLSTAMIAEAKRLHPGLPFRVGDASDLSVYNDGKFDCVLFSFNGLDLLHPYEFRKKCVGEAWRVLRRGGLFVYSSHNRAFVDAHKERNTPIGYYRHTPTGETVYATHIMEQVRQMAESGFKMRECHTGDIYNYYMAEKAEPGGEPRIIKPRSRLLSLPGKALRKLWRMASPPMRQTIVIDLSRPLNVIWTYVVKSRRQEIVKGENGSIFRVATPDDSTYLAFDDERSRDMGLFPLPSKWAREGHAFTAERNGSIVASLLVHERGKSLVLRRDLALREHQHAHAALMWHAVKWAKGMGFREFDQGGYDADRHPEVSFYKSRFGGKVCMRRQPDA